MCKFADVQRWLWLEVLIWRSKVQWRCRVADKEVLRCR